MIGTLGALLLCVVWNGAVFAAGMWAMWAKPWRKRIAFYDVSERRAAGQAAPGYYRPDDEVFAEVR